jgi:Tetracyclin repressor-like, C-terminal domain
VGGDTVGVERSGQVLAAERTQDMFLDIVGRRRARHYGALLLTTAHGAASFELSGHFVWDKWQTTTEQLIDLMIALLPAEKPTEK